MPWLRFKRWNYLTPLAPAVSVCGSGRRYVCTGAAQGVVPVPYRADVEELLHPSGDVESSWDVAWDRYGVAFDAKGCEMPASVPSTGSASVGTWVTPPGPVATSVGVPVGPPKRGRPPKR